ncbi:MAG: NADH-quinone oxidoreductase subunit K [Pseudomonadota bacterium]
MLTAIVVGVATLSVGLALVVRIREAYGTIEADEVRAMDIVTADAQDADDIELAAEAS